MQYSQILFLFFTLLIPSCSVCNARDCSNPPKNIAVGKPGPGIFQTIQSAINSIPTNNTQWIHIRISAGTYAEKVQIAAGKSCIFLEGAGSSSTIIQWNDHDEMDTSSTFESLATNIMARGITFENTYNRPPRFEDGDQKGNLPAVAAKVEGDKTAFYKCAFKGVQDTLFDNSGRHYFYNCYIQGEIDFIYGNGQSIYEKCMINFRAGPDGPQGISGYITAQARESMDETSGFVFKECNVTGIGKVHLGRAYRAYSRVIFANSYLSQVVDPEGWYAWHYSTHKAKLTFVEEGCTGPGAKKSKRVPWLKHMDANELNKFLSLSYIDQDRWLSNLPTSF